MNIKPLQIGFHRSMRSTDLCSRGKKVISACLWFESLMANKGCFYYIKYTQQDEKTEMTCLIKIWIIRWWKERSEGIKKSADTPPPLRGLWISLHFIQFFLSSLRYIFVWRVYKKDGVYADRLIDFIWTFSIQGEWNYCLESLSLSCNDGRKIL